jgi:surfeit locus 1 family protein
MLLGKRARPVHTKHATRSSAANLVFALLGVLLFAGFVALGTWQLERRAWKHDLISRVEQRVHAHAVAAPFVADWPGINSVHDEYLRVDLTGQFQHDKETLVQAVTRLGSGFWVLTPLRRADGSMVLINRGFVPPETSFRAARAATEPKGEVTVTGLLRLTEPGGAFLRHNDALTDRWFSRDVAAIAAARGLGPVAPFFVDAAASAAAASERLQPVGGLTVVSFTDNHFVYALTWYALALMVVGAAWRVVREQQRGNA